MRGSSRPVESVPPIDTMRYHSARMGLIVAAVGTGLVWITRLGAADRALWPSVLATAGFWLLGGLHDALRRARR